MEHLIHDCENYSTPLWRELGESLTQTLRTTTGKDMAEIRLTPLEIIYNKIISISDQRPALLWTIGNQPKWSSSLRESEREKATSQLFIEQSQSTTPIYYSLLPQARCHPRVAQASPGIDIPIQADLTLEPGESQATDSGIQFYSGLIGTSRVPHKGCIAHIRLD